VRYSVIFSLLLCCCATPCAVAAPPVLQIATSLSKSELSGRIEQQLQQAYQQLGYQMQLVRLPAGRSLQMTNQGLYDGELFRIDGVQHEFPQLLQVPVQLASIKLLAYVASPRAQELQQWARQSDLRIGYVRGFRLVSQVRFAGKALPVTTLEQALGMLRQGKVDVLLEDQQSLLSLLPEGLAEAGISAQSGVLAEAGLYHYVHQRHAAIVPSLSRTLQNAVGGHKH